MLQSQWDHDITQVLYSITAIDQIFCILLVMLHFFKSYESNRFVLFT